MSSVFLVRRQWTAAATMILCFICLCSVSHSTGADEFQSQLHPLMKLKAAFQNSNPAVFSSWVEGNSFCNFTGIRCSSNGLVAEINLSSRNLSGTVPFDEICSLRSLKRISLASNSLRGRITEDLKSCVGLQYLDLGYNQFAGEVPDLSALSELRMLSLNLSGISGKFPWKSLENVTHLEFLSLGDNPFDLSPFPTEVLKLHKLYWLYLSNCSINGRIPIEIRNLTLLQNLELADNNLTGEIPESIGNLKNLWQLELYDNALSGKLPNGFGNLTNLVNLDASMNYLQGDLSELRFLTNLAWLQLFDNQFVGEIPKEFEDFKNLQNLSIYGNMLTGTLPQKLGSWSGMDLFDVSENFLTGPIPPEMCKNNKMRWLSMLQNNFTGGIPETYADCKSLEGFRLSNNSLSGIVPRGIWGLPNVTIIDLALNQFRGPVISDIGKAESLEQLFLDHNGFSGYIPDSLGRCSSISYITISHNNFTGEIPSSLCKLIHLEVLKVSNNHLSGTIPNCFGTLCGPDSQVSKLRSLDFSNNQFQGKVPVSLIQCGNLEVLNLGHNQISDTFPFWLARIPELQVLVLRRNRFYGPIWDPHSEFHYGFAKLRIIDLSFNEFDGNLPSEYFKSWTAMIQASIDQDSPKLKYMGDNQSYYQDSVTVKLTVKGLEVELVKILTIFTSIDLSNNRFGGEIPTSLGSLQSLVVLNLSSNSFRGVIPWSFGNNLRELESLDISKNKLSGRIPQQFVKLTFLGYLNLSHNHFSGLIPQGGQMGTFPASAYEGNLELCGFPLPTKCEQDVDTPAPDHHQSEMESEAESIFEFGWRVVMMGYGCGVPIGFVAGHIIISKRLI